MDGDLLILVRVRVELVDLFFVVTGLGEGIDGVGRRKGCVLVGMVGHCGGSQARGGNGEEGEEGIKGNGEVGRGRVFNKPHKRGELSSSQH